LNATAMSVQPVRHGIDRISFSADGSCVTSESENGEIISHPLSLIGDAAKCVFDANLTRSGDWIVDQASNRTVWRLPGSMVESCTDSHSNLLVIGEEVSGAVVVLFFPPANFSSPETRAVENQQRK
jgi:hypothetical protein